jgi:hypothetical protein
MEGIKLKKTEVVEKKTEDNFMEKYQETIHSVFMDVYYESIKDFTFKTKFFQLSKIHGEVITDAHEKSKGKVSLTEKQKDSLHDLIQFISDSISEYGSIFLKLSSRSPKDVSNDNLNKFVDEEFSKLSNEELKENNSRIFAVQKAAMRLMKVTNIDRALELLILSTRVYEDFQDELEAKKFDISLVVREWVDVDIDMEFRGFVYGGKLVAVSQYNYLCFFPHIKEKKLLIEKRLKELYELVKPSIDLHIKDSNCIIDFYVKLDFEKYEDVKDCVGIIELNPFEITTGACLFSWQQDEKLLTGKSEDFEFRIVEKVRDDIKKCISPEYYEYYRLIL